MWLYLFSDWDFDKISMCSYIYNKSAYMYHVPFYDAGTPDQ